MPFSIADCISIPKLAVRRDQATEHNAVIGLRPLMSDEDGYPMSHPTQISLILHFRPSTPPSSRDEFPSGEDDDEELERDPFEDHQLRHGIFLGYSLHWQGEVNRPLFDLNVFRPKQGQNFPSWYEQAIDELAQYINGCLLFTGQGWRLDNVETRVPKPLGGFIVNDYVAPSPMEMAFRHMVQKRKAPTQLELWETTPWLYVGEKRYALEPCVVLK